MFVFIWKYVEDFTLKHLLALEICARETCEKFVYKYRAYFLKNLQTSRANSTGILKIKNAKVSGYWFYMNTNIFRDFQIYISVPLNETSLSSGQPILTL